MEEKFRCALNLCPSLDNVGELNYVLTRICLNYLELKGEKNQTNNDIIDTLERVKLNLGR